jgi:hypothetical protein
MARRFSIRKLSSRLRAAPLWARYCLLAAGVLAALGAVNWLVQVARKPAELWFPVSGVLSKTTAQTWQAYAPLFRRHATASITPELLAALAQAEGAGNPVARTYWRWRLTHQPFEIYRPASSAVGMYQITDGTFREAKRYCVRGHQVAEDGPWHDWRSCWFNWLYVRVIPGHAVEMTAALLDRRVASIAPHRWITAARSCFCCGVARGAAGGAAYAARGFRPAPGQRCGDHDLRRYLARVNAVKRSFADLAALG